MSSGRRESVWRHIKNPRIHNGQAKPIPFVEYVAGRQSGFCPPNSANNYLRRKNRSFNSAFHSIHEPDILSKFQGKIQDKILDGFADKLAGMTYISNSICSPTRHITKPAVSSRIMVNTEKKMSSVLADICVLSA
jgi:hypothetical protein